MKNRIRSDEFSVDIMGGLGNQLFCYGTALYLTRILGRQPVINIGLFTKYRPKRMFELDYFQLPVEIPRINLRGITGKKILRTLALRLPIISLLFRKILGLYVSPEVGFDAGLINAKSARHFHGYFQSYKYTEYLQNRLQLQNPSLWYETTKSEILKQESIIIHFRRGDLVKHKETVGLLSPDYYSECFKLTLKSYRQPRIFVFSDSLELAREDLSFLLNFDVNWIDPPAVSNSAESLLLMSLGKSLICSNSTFSWWAAKWSAKESQIYIPNKWFRNLSDPLFIYPENWNRVKSQWIP